MDAAVVGGCWFPLATSKKATRSDFVFCCILFTKKFVTFLTQKWGNFLYFFFGFYSVNLTKNFPFFWWGGEKFQNFSIE
jgi:hypothetical protein